MMVLLINSSCSGLLRAITATFKGTLWLPFTSCSSSSRCGYSIRPILLVLRALSNNALQVLEFISLRLLLLLIIVPSCTTYLLSLITCLRWAFTFIGYSSAVCLNTRFIDLLSLSLISGISLLCLLFFDNFKRGTAFYGHYSLQRGSTFGYTTAQL